MKKKRILRVTEMKEGFRIDIGAAFKDPKIFGKILGAAISAYAEAHHDALPDEGVTEGQVYDRVLRGIIDQLEEDSKEGKDEKKTVTIVSPITLDELLNKLDLVHVMSEETKKKASSSSSSNGSSSSSEAH